MARRFFLPALSTIEVRGSDRVKWLAGLVTSDLAKLSSARGSYGLVLSKVGRILTDACVLIDGDRLLVGVSAPPAEIVAHLERHLVMEDVDLRDATADGAWAFVLDAEHPDLGAEIELGLPSLRALWFPEAERAARVSMLGEQLSQRAWDTLRLEASIPAFGVDFDAKTYPQEAALEHRAVSFQKGCYLGQEVVCRLQMRGQVHRLLVPFTSEGAPPVAGDAVVVDGADVGHVTSAVDVGGRVRGLAMLKRAFAEPGTAVAIGDRPAQISPR